MVPHWLRGEETAALVQFPGMAENTTQKIVLCALGASVATPPEGITAEVVAVKNFDELKSLSRDKIAGKIVLFNYPFDKQIAAEGRGGDAYGTVGGEYGRVCANSQQRTKTIGRWNRS